MDLRLRIVLLAACCASSVLVAQQRGGDPVEFCSDDERCIDDTLEIVFANGTSTYDGSLEVGTRIPAEIVTQTVTSGVQLWAFAVKSDERFAKIVEATTEGTLADPAHPDAVVGPPSFDATLLVPGGMISAIVPGFFGLTELPVGEFNVICRIEVSIEAEIQGSSMLELVSGEIGPRGSPPTEIHFTVEGRSAQPRTLYQGALVASRPFLRGDVNGDGKLHVTDAFWIVQVAVGNLPARFDCDDALDANNDGNVDLMDALPIFSWLFLRGPNLDAPLVGECELDAATPVGCNESNCQ